MGSTPEYLWAKVEESIVWESQKVKLLGVTVEKNLNFNEHLYHLQKKSSLH